jgi:hypothetical protein
MMSREGDTGYGHHFPPHVMMFYAHTDWAKDPPGSPIFAEPADYLEPITIFNVQVPMYSDGTPRAMGPH